MRTVGDPVAEHFDRLLRLLELESRHEAQDAHERAQRLSPALAEASGFSLIGLVVEEERGGFGGRTVLVLRRRNRTEALPWTRMRSGSPVVLSVTPGRNKPYRGVVAARRQATLEVVLSDELEELDEDARVRVDLSNDEISIARQREAVQTAKRTKDSRVAHLRDVLLGLRAPTFDEPGPGVAAFLDVSLNEVQREAVRFAMSARDVALIHGPPGTGKTSTLVEVIRQSVQRGARVLACAPSNLAADNLLERLAGARERVVRVGHPARVDPAWIDFTLDLLVEASEDVKRARKLVKEAVRLRRQSERWTRARPEPGEKERLRREARAMIDDARRMEDLAAERVLDHARVVVSTTSIDPTVLGRRTFDLVVVDEACQSTEVAAWVPLLRADRVVLGGDHRQLPPTVLSPEAERLGFGISLFERLAERYGSSILRRLDVQYRMHESIMQFPSLELYEGTLVADPSVAQHTLFQLSGVANEVTTREPIRFVDTAGAGFDETLEEDGESRQNLREAECLVVEAQRLVELGVQPSQIAVITPYAAQVRLITRLLEAADLATVDVDSVDGFQGREREVVLISLVRSNAGGDLGFLRDVRRMNVAWTRARRRLWIIGDSATLASDDFYRRMIEHLEHAGAYSSVWE